ncbi:hypothetical protein [Nonomuraea sp. NPDC049504]|uniref:hypothetical protein n=1 Tax=Nonomuraea sp. NPDC049504 TaxID=3154729 RepID=UPI003417F99B
MARTPASSQPPRPNELLKALLEEVGWPPETLARKINAVLEHDALSSNACPRRVHEKTPYHWLRGKVPHAPVRDIIVDLLSQALDRPIAFDALWPASARSRPVPPSSDLIGDIPWDHEGLQTLLGKWPLSMPTRRTFLVLSGAALTGPAWQWLDTPVPNPAHLGTGSAVVPPMVDLVETIVAEAQQLDEQHGSSAADFVAAQFTAVARLVRHGSYDAAVGKRLCAALAQLAQTSGWMALEAGDDGKAQRWYMTGLRAAHSAGDPALASSIMALMSYQAITLRKLRDGLQLSAVATKTAARAPSIVQAIIAARSTLVHASAGDHAGVECSRERAADLLTRAAQESAPPPRWAGYVNAAELDAISGRALIALARHTPGRRRALLTSEAAHLLHERALDPSDVHRRSALRHGAWLSRAHLHNGDLEQAVSVAQFALQRLPQVTSARCAALLADLRTDLIPYTRGNAAVRDLIADLDRQLPRQDP